MKKIKQPSVAGMFYTDDKDELIKQINYFENEGIKDYAYETRAVIVPHAGYIYSGQLAYNSIQYIDKSVENIFIFAPAHKVPLSKIALSSYDEWETPLGNIALNKEINQIIIENFDSSYVDEAFAQEHAIEVQVPFLQNHMGHMKNFNIIPILIGDGEATTVKKIINYFYGDEKNAFVISSDLSHFHNAEKAKEIDNATANMIEANDIQGLSYEQACGATGLYAFMNFVTEKNFSLIRVGMYNSGEVSGETNRVVGYGGWILYEGEKNKFIEKFFPDYIIDICRKSIQYCLTHGRKMEVSLPSYVPEVFKEMGACFVTLEINGNLRGCIGSIIAYRALIEDLILNSYNAAFKDPRFEPLTEEEFKNVKISVSLLSTPLKMQFENESDLLSKIEENFDGIIIKDGSHQAVYLPSVWEQLPKKLDFIQSLKVKAGLEPTYFSKNFEAYKFNTIYIQE